jgi:hypothetical protein
MSAALGGLLTCHQSLQLQLRIVNLLLELCRLSVEARHYQCFERFPAFRYDIRLEEVF